MPEILQTAESYLREFVAPKATAIDGDSAVLRSALAGLGERSLLGLRLSPEWSGSEASAKTFNRFQMLISQHSGALAFLQTQHQSAGAMLLKSKNAALKQTYLPAMSAGKKLVGIGFSQLRRQPPPLQARAIPGGYRLQGQVPWVTGFGCFQTFLAAAALPDGRAVFGMVPFSPQAQLQETAAAEIVIEENSGSIRFSQPLSLAAMSSANTVKVTLKDWFLADESVAFVHPPGWIEQNDRRNVLRAVFLPLGCARAGLEIVATSPKRQSLAFIDPALQQLEREFAACWARVTTLQTASAEAFEQSLAVRAWAIDLAVRCAQAAIAVSSGAANAMEHPAQRVYREALVWMVSGQTPALMASTLDRLVR